jgi:hypothetical protein
MKLYREELHIFCFHEMLLGPSSVGRRGGGNGCETLIGQFVGKRSLGKPEHSWDVGLVVVMG